jgi:hypothetical protein
VAAILHDTMHPFAIFSQRCSPSQRTGEHWGQQIINTKGCRCLGRQTTGCSRRACALTRDKPGARCLQVHARRNDSKEDLGEYLNDLVLPIAASLMLASPALADVSFANEAPQVDNGWLTPIVNGLDYVLGNIESVYLGLGLPYAYGWSIVSLTLFVKVLTLPLTKKQVESALSVQQLKPRIDIIKERYGDDKKKVQKETSRLYEQARVNPLAGCTPSLLQLPIFLGLYRSLNNVALSGTLDNEGFFWIPSLAGAPLSDCARSFECVPAR